MMKITSRHHVFNGYIEEEDKQQKMELNKHTRNKLKSKYSMFIGEEIPSEIDNYSIVLHKVSESDSSRKYNVIKNNSDCGGKHLLLLCDPVNLLAFGGNSEGNNLTVYGRVK